MPNPIQLQRVIYPGAGGGAVPFVGALDGYSALLTSAFSLVRRLLTSYEGNLIRIRRVSDNVEQNFGPLAGGRLDVASILTFLGGGGGKLVTVYDQFGSNNWTQSTAAMQPDWVEALSEFNGAPALFSGSSKGMSCNMSPTLPYSIMLTECNPNAAFVYSSRTLDSTVGNKFICAGRTDAGQAFDGGTIAPAINTALPVCEILAAPNGGNYSFYSNGINVTTGSITAQNWGPLRMGSSGVWGEVANSNVAEMATFNTNLSSGQVTALQAIFNPATL